MRRLGTLAIRERFGGARQRRAGLVTAVAAGLFGVGLAGASGASALTFVHSAKSGQLQGGRLTLHGVGGRVSYTTPSGRTGTAALKHLHKGVFLPGRPATAILHVAGHRGGDEPSFRLSSPRYSAARRTLSFKARRLDGKRLPGSFGPSSLTVTPHATVAPGQDGGNDCDVWFTAQAASLGNPWLYPQTYGAWSTDTWNPAPDQDWKGDIDRSGYSVWGGSFAWISDGGDLRGCSNTVVFEWAAGGGDGVTRNHVLPGTFTITTTWPWGGSPTSTCNGNQNGAVMDGNGDWKCVRADRNGQIIWQLVGA
jgi:hypothetical protein